MKENFDKAVEFVLAHEGGYVCDPFDPGGETRWGISKRAHPTVDIRNLTREGAIAIYKASYWNAMKCDDYPWPIDAILFDTAVNQGPSYAAMIAFNGVKAFDLLFARLKNYSAIVKRRPASARYLRGWINRILDLYEFTKEGP